QHATRAMAVFASGKDRQRQGFGDGVALGVVDAEIFEAFQDCYVFDVFGDGLDAHHVRDVPDGADDGPVDTVVNDVADEAAVDLQEINVQVSEVGEGVQAGAELAERHPAAELLDC